MEGNESLHPEATPQKRRPKRRHVDKPEPSEPDLVVSERISVIKNSLAGVVRDRDFLGLLLLVVVVGNQMAARVSMLAKELLLTMLEKGDPLPKLNQGFYSALYTSLRYGKWEFEGYDDLLAKRRVADPGLGCVMHVVMSYVARQFAAEVDTHYRQHYEKFYKKWKNVCGPDGDKEKKENTVDPYLLDPDETLLESLVVAAWNMRRDLEAVEARGFALFPERSIKVSYITLDAICIAHLYRQLYPESFRVPGKRPGTTKAKLIGDVAMEHDEEIFAKLFDLETIRGMRKTHHFRFSLQTDGVGVTPSFGRWTESVHKPMTDWSRTKKRKTKQASLATTKNVTELQPGYAYSYRNKALNSLDHLKGMTIRVCVAPTLRWTCSPVTQTFARLRKR